MSRFITSIRFAAAAIILLFATMRPAAAQNYQDYQDYEGGSASYQQFYDDLSPYGEWVDDPEYGYVWIPDAGDDFRPYYSNGYWANTDYGNTWVSNYDWGWAPFHYGRWTYSSYYGWLWIPGNEWGPAWVSWRSGGGSYGWAALGPGVSVSMAFGNYYAPDYWWTFTPQQYILSPNFHNYCYGPRYNSNYIRRTTIINNSYVRNRRTYIAGPRRNELERAIGRPVQTYAINNINRPSRAEVRGNSLAIYRPQIAETRPRATERPRQFSEARQPITKAPGQMTVPADRAMGREPVRDRNQQWQQQNGTDRAPVRDRSPMQDRAPVTERPFRGRENNQIDRMPQQDRAPVTERPFRGRENNQIDRMPQQDRTPVYQQPGRTYGRQPSRQAEIQRGEQVDQQRIQQQRNEQMQQQRMQQQRSEQMQQQQRNEQMQQQRMQQQRSEQMQQQQRNEQMQQQRMQQMQQQRNDQAQQQRMQQQRNEQMQQQRMQQMQQRSEQRPQEEARPQPQHIERPMMEQRQQPVQRIEAPRNETPRAEPQQEARPDHGGGRFRR